MSKFKVGDYVEVIGGGYLVTTIGSKGIISDTAEGLSFIDCFYIPGKPYEPNKYDHLLVDDIHLRLDLSSHIKVGDTVVCSSPIHSGPKKGDVFTVTSMSVSNKYIGFKCDYISISYNNEIRNGIKPNWGITSFKKIRAGSVPETTISCSFCPDDIYMTRMRNKFKKTIIEYQCPRCGRFKDVVAA